MNNINIETFYPYEKEIVWKALTDKDYIGKWIMKTDFELVKDKEFTLVDKPTIGWDGKVQCKLVDFHQYKKLVYNWNNNNSKIVTVVEWELESKDNGTVLKINHYGFSGISGALTKKVLTAGWTKMMTKQLEPVLKEIANGK